jgi:hypothetical protein
VNPNHVKAPCTSFEPNPINLLSRVPSHISRVLVVGMVTISSTSSDGEGSLATKQASARPSNGRRRDRGKTTRYRTTLPDGGRFVRSPEAPTGGLFSSKVESEGKRRFASPATRSRPSWKLFVLKACHNACSWVCSMFDGRSCCRRVSTSFSLSVAFPEILMAPSRATR